MAGELGDWYLGASGVAQKVELSNGKGQDDQRARAHAEGRGQCGAWVLAWVEMPHKWQEMEALGTLF